MSQSTQSLSDRIFSSFPSGNYCLESLFRILEIVESTRVPTACVECAESPRMFINPEFVAAHAETPEKLLMLVMHELHHVVLGHTRLFERANPLDNLVFDAVINAMLCRLLPEPGCLALLTDYYKEDSFPQCFLRPPEGWHPQLVDSPLPRALLTPEHEKHAPLYRALYEGSGATCSELREAFTRAGETSECGPISLLGDHRGDGEESSSDGGLEWRAPVLLEALSETVQSWKSPASSLFAQHLGGSVKTTRIEVLPPTLTRLSGLMRRIGGCGLRGRLRQLGSAPTPVVSPVPCSDRRSVVARALGASMLLHRHEISCRRMIPDGHRVHVYVDVSGSMDRVASPISAAVRGCGDAVHPIIHLFSTMVADVTLAQFAQGVCKSSGGTSIECVAAHMRANGVRRAVLVTDGHVGIPSQLAAAILRRVRLGVALTPDTSTRAPLDGFVDEWLQLVWSRP